VHTPKQVVTEAPPGDGRHSLGLPDGRANVIMPLMQLRTAQAMITFPDLTFRRRDHDIGGAPAPPK